MSAEELYFLAVKTVHGYGTREGWARDERRFCWDLHDLRGKVRASVTDEALRPALSGTPRMRRDAQASIVRRFCVPLPVLDGVAP